jgi:hypothetical protein
VAINLHRQTDRQMGGWKDAVKFFYVSEFWEVLVVGEGQGRQAGSLKYPPRKAHASRN